MERREIIKWLSRPFEMHKEIRYLTNVLPLWETLAIKATSNPSEPLGAGGSGQGGRMENYSVLIVDGRKELEELEREYPKVKKEVLAVVNRVATPKYRNLLMGRYIRYEKWKTIAKDTGYSEIHVRSELLWQATRVVGMYLDRLENNT